MSINIKLVCKVLLTVFILSLFVMALIKFVVLPTKLAVSNKSMEICELKQTNEKLTNDLANAKTAVINDINKEEIIRLKNYISSNTQVLTDVMVEDAATSLITYANTYEIPIALVVGIAQATSNFNTTYLSKDGHRGILALPNKLWKDTKVNINYIKNGADIGCNVLRNIMKKTTNVTDILVIYFDDLKYTSNYKDDIFKYSLMYMCYSK